MLCQSLFQIVGVAGVIAVVGAFEGVNVKTHKLLSFERFILRQAQDERISVVVVPFVLNLSKHLV